MPKPVVTLRLEESVIADLDKLAGNLRSNRSKIVERILELFLEQDRLSQNKQLLTKGGLQND